MKNLLIPIILSAVVLTISSFMTTVVFVASHGTASLNCKTFSAWGTARGIGVNEETGLACKLGESLGDVVGNPEAENSKEQPVKDVDVFAPNLPDVPGTPDPGQGLPQLIAFIYGFAIWIVGAVVFIQITRAGVMRLIAAGRAGEIAKANSLMMNAIFGLILLLSSVVILNTINPNLTINAFEFPKFTGATPGIDSSLVP